MKLSRSARRRGVASVVGTILFVIVLVAALGAQEYMTSLQGESSQIAEQAQQLLDQHGSESLVYSSSAAGLTATDKGGVSVNLVDVVLKFANGTVYTFPEDTSLPSGASVVVASLIPDGDCGEATCAQKYDSIVSGGAPGSMVGLVTSLGNTFWSPCTVTTTNTASTTPQNVEGNWTRWVMVTNSSFSYSGTLCDAGNDFLNLLALNTAGVMTFEIETEGGYGMMYANIQGQFLSCVGMGGGFPGAENPTGILSQSAYGTYSVSIGTPLNFGSYPQNMTIVKDGTIIQNVTLPPNQCDSSHYLQNVAMDPTGRLIVVAWADWGCSGDTVYFEVFQGQGTPTSLSAPTTPVANTGDVMSEVSGTYTGNGISTQSISVGLRTSMLVVNYLGGEGHDSSEIEIFYFAPNGTTASAVNYYAKDQVYRSTSTNDSYPFVSGTTINVGSLSEAFGHNSGYYPTYLNQEGVNYSYFAYGNTAAPQASSSSGTLTCGAPPSSSSGSVTGTPNSEGNWVSYSLAVKTIPGELMEFTPEAYEVDNQGTAYIYFFGGQVIKVNSTGAVSTIENSPLLEGSVSVSELFSVNNVYSIMAHNSTTLSVYKNGELLTYIDSSYRYFYEAAISPNAEWIIIINPSASNLSVEIWKGNSAPSS